MADLDSFNTNIHGASPDAIIRSVRQSLQALKELVKANPYIAASLFDANTILKADTDDTPEALTVATNSLVGRQAGEIDDIAIGEQKIVGRITGGNVTGLTLQTLIDDPGSDEKLVTEKAVRDLFGTSSTGEGRISFTDYMVMAGLP